MPPPQVSFFTPGTRLAHGDSYIITNQAYVQYIPAARSHSSTSVPRLPILFLHGGGLTGAIYESTPDLRPGWAPRAAAAGHPVYILDAVDSGRSQRAPDAQRTGAVQHRTARQVWERFRFVPVEAFESRTAFAGGQSPVEAFDAFLAGQSARRYSTDEVEAAGIRDAVRAVGECYVIAHSNGAVLALKALREGGPTTAGLVRRIVLVEPGPARYDKPMDWIEGLGGGGVVVLWGDFLDGHAAWTEISRVYEEGALGAEVVSLPAVGIRGNSHFPMCDKNSDEVIDFILKRLVE